jgi:2-dehydro-3-deoxygalactonokinase
MNKLMAIVDMGTSNSRLFITDVAGNIRISVQDEFGVKDQAITGSREVLLNGLRKILNKAVREAHISRDQIECFLCSGMITSEIGLAEIPHCTAPVCAQDFARETHEQSFMEILPVPFFFIPGVKNRVDKSCATKLDDMDFMRGEETQVFGAIDLFEIKAPVTFVFLSSHTKLVDVDENYRITRSFTQNIDTFDIIIYIDCRAEDAQHRVIERARNGALADYIDFKILKKIGDAAFEMADGEEIIIPMSPVRIKIRPKDGYRDIENLRMILKSRGLDVEGLSKEELLFAYCFGKPKSGIVPYVKFGAYNNEILSGAFAALRVATAKKMLS